MGHFLNIILIHIKYGQSVLWNTWKAHLRVQRQEIVNHYQKRNHY